MCNSSWKRSLASLVLLASTAVSARAAAPEAPCSIDKTAQQVSVFVSVKDLSSAVIQRAAIELRCGELVYNTQTDAEGAAKLRAFPGTWRLTVLAPGFSDSVRSVQLSSAAKDIDVTLATGSATDVVNVTADSGFVPFASNAGSKTGALLLEVPQSISIVNSREMEARGVTTVNEALRYTPGVQADEFGVELRFDWLKIRGFSAETFGIFRDGMRFNSLSGKLDPFELESVEVLKGPSSILYGEVPPGGLINQVTKRPPSEAYREFGVLFGSYNRRQFQADLGGPVDKNQVWRYRLLGLVRDSGTQTNFTPDNRRLIAPSLTWHPSDRTNITVLADYQHDGTRWSQFLPASGTLYNNNPNGIIPVSTFVGEPGFEKVKRDQDSVAYTADHLFEDGWNVHSNYRYQYINFQGTTVYGGGFVTGSNRLVNRYAYALPRWNSINTVDTRALRRFATKNWEHTVLFGYDYAHVDIRSQQAFESVAPIDIYAPVYGVTTIPTLVPYISQDSLLQQHGLYGQDQIKYKRHLVFTLGGRQDFAINDLADFLTASNSSHHLDERFTGRAGVTYLTDYGIAPYFAYSTSFLPNPATPIYNPANPTVFTAAKPSDGRQIEGGVKIQPRTWTSFITASVFNLTQTNVIVPDAAFNNLQSGEVRSRGVELEGLANVARGLNLHASYTLTATDTTKDITPANVGKWLPQTPRNQTSGIADYTVPGGRFAGLGGNFGVRFVGTNAADSANSFFVPNYTLYDASLRFGYRHTLFSVNASNITDRRYVATCSGLSYCYYGYARNVIGSAKYRF